MLIKLLSDIHSEFYRTETFIGLDLIGPEDSETTLILAGDIGKPGNGKMINSMFEELLDNFCERFKHVVFVNGNHEYYGGRVDKVDSFMINFDDSVENFHFLNGDWRVLDGVLFVGGTLWTDFNNFSPLEMADAKLFMNDYQAITIKQVTHYRKFRPTDAYDIHKKHLKAIWNALKEHKDKKRVVVTHHLPSFECIHPRYKTSRYATLNHAYATNLEGFILEHQPDLWVSGHTHDGYDFNIGETRLMCNPMGYPNVYGGLENENHDPRFLIEL